MQLVIKKMPKNKRIEWLDYVRAWGIIFIIFAHALSPSNPIRVWLYSFHVPLFFFVSGYIFNPKKYQNITSFLKRKFKILIVPYIFYAAIAIPFLFIYFGETNFLNVVLKFLLQQRYWAFWFITVIFLVELIAYMYLRNKNTMKNIAILIILSAIINVIYHHFTTKFLIWNLDLVPLVLPFFLAGFIFQNYPKMILKRSWLITILLANILFTFLNYKTNNYGVDIYYNIYGSYLYFMAASLSGVVFVFFLIKNLNFRIKLLSKVGKNTFPYFLLHQIIIFPMVSSIYYSYFKYDLRSDFLVGILSSIIITIITLYITYGFTLGFDTIKNILKRRNK